MKSSSEHHNTAALRQTEKTEEREKWLEGARGVQVVLFRPPSRSLPDVRDGVDRALTLGPFFAVPGTVELLLRRGPLFTIPSFLLGTSRSAWLSEMRGSCGEHHTQHG